LFAALLAGFVSFVSPCVLPIVPGYLSFISGVNLVQLKGKGAPAALTRRVALTSVFFVLGFSTVFVAGRRGHPRRRAAPDAQTRGSWGA
jgi:cytochrome c-type biogenesis protein